MKKITVVVKRAGGEADVVRLKPRLETFQYLVEGNIEGITPTEYLSEHNIVIYCNDEGKFNGLLPNLFFSEIKDILYGTCIFVKGDDEGNDISMTQDEVKHVLELCAEKDVRRGILRVDVLKLFKS